MTLDPKRFKQIEDLYHAVRMQPSGVREAVLARETAGDAPLRREVESLLRHASDGDDFLTALLPGDPDMVRRVAPNDLLGPYRIVEFIGAGGMGEVYRAHDPRLQRDIAIKVMPAGTEAARLPGRLLAEAQAAGALNHPNILSVYDVGTEDGVPFIVSELLRGETLRERLSRGPLGAADAQRITADVARGLVAAHDEGIVHRDLKPDNVFLTADGRVKILDFGLARHARGADDDSTPSDPSARFDAAGPTTWAAAGTPGYMSPEQRRGEAVDHRSDVFALGAMLHELLTGTLTTDGPAPEADPESLEGVIARCVRSAPGDRFQSARDVLAALESTQLTPAPDRSALRGPRRLMVGLAAVAVAALVLISTRSSWTPRLEPAPVPTNARANEAYMRGRFFLAKSTEADIRKAIDYFNEAAVADPTSAQPHAGLADAYTALRSVYAAPSEVMPQARAAAAMAIALDPALAEAHVSMGGVLMYYDFDWPAAEREFQRAIELSPRLASAHDAYGLLLAALGRHREAQAALARARELDPLSLPILIDAGWVSYLARDFEQMIVFDQKATELDAAFAPAYRDLGLGYEKQRRFPEAIAALQKARALDTNATLLEMLGGAYAAAAQPDAARRVLADLAAMAQQHYVCPYEVATVHAGLGDVDATMEWLEKGYQQHADCMPWAASDAKLDALRALPRFQDLMRRMGLPLG